MSFLQFHILLVLPWITFNWNLIMRHRVPGKYMWAFSEGKILSKRPFWCYEWTKVNFFVAQLPHPSSVALSSLSIFTGRYQLLCELHGRRQLRLNEVMKIKLTVVSWWGVIMGYMDMCDAPTSWLAKECVVWNLQIRYINTCYSIYKHRTRDYFRQQQFKGLK